MGFCHHLHADDAVAPAAERIPALATFQQLNHPSASVEAAVSPGEQCDAETS